MSHGFKQGALAVCGHLLVARNLGCIGGFLRLVAGLIAALVGVRGLGGDPFVGGDELEGVLHVPAVAAVVLARSVAVHDFLLGERDQFLG